MHISQTIFAGSSTTLKQCPHTDKPAYAFIGRSNVGKSSLINMLLGRKNIAKTSSTPGKTQLINHFLVNQSFCLVDLPGYGWAKVSKVKRAQWQAMWRNYLCYSPSLISVFLLIDARHMPQPIDITFLHWIGYHQIPCAMVFTKADKCTSRNLQKHLKAFKDKVLLRWQSFPPFFITSAITHKGRDQLLLYMQQHMS